MNLLMDICSRLHVLDNLGIDFDSDAVQNCVREVAEGGRFLRNSSEDDLKNMERNRGMPFIEPEQLELLGHHRDWCKGN